MTKKKLQAPKWCADAVATSRGWENEKTGEIYVANRHLLDSVDTAPAQMIIEPAPAVVEAAPKLTAKQKKAAKAKEAKAAKASEEKTSMLDSMLVEKEAE